MVQVAPGIDEVLEVTAEHGIVHTCLLRQDFRLSVGVSHHHLLVCRPVGIRGKVCVTRLLIEAIDTLHHILVLHNLT